MLEKIRSDMPVAAVPGLSRAIDAMERCVRLQADIPARNWWQRALGLSPLSADTRPLFRAARAVRAVGDELRRLGPEWRVVSGVRLDDGSVIEQLVVGPGGVLTIVAVDVGGHELWVSGGTFLVGDDPGGHIHEALGDATMLSRALSAAPGLDAAAPAPVVVRACIVPVSSRGMLISRVPSRVAVLSLSELVPWLRGQSEVLQPETIEQIADAVARRSEESTDERVRSAFAALESAVGAAQRIRLAWIAAVLLAPWAGLMVMVGGLALAGTR